MKSIPRVVFVGIESELLHQQLERMAVEVLQVNFPVEIWPATPQGFGCIVIDLKADAPYGLEVIRRLTTERPTFPVVVWSRGLQVPEAVEAMCLGCVEVVERTGTSCEIVMAIQEATRRGEERLRQQQQRASFVDRLHALPDGQLSTLMLLMSGRSRPQIAQALHVTLDEIDSRCDAILTELECNSVADLTHEWARAFKRTGGERQTAG